jgi:hypothetical protein
LLTLSCRQKDRLFERWSAKKVDNIERDFEALRGAYEREPFLKHVLDQCSSMTTFDEGWSYVEKRFENLNEFCGGLASVFPGTSTMEIDFSIVNLEKDYCRVSLSNIFGWHLSARRLGMIPTLFASLSGRARIPLDHMR